ncbi:aminoglycoside phosphotransferase family protein (plasmid) [Kitasatospora sp. NBC_00070]|uniref:phosphotransferase enzyme family protein n=1 Tax=Kitasatospora sp. NBC_00070 TaxID=2975962 RepID=UPI0032561602
MNDVILYVAEDFGIDLTALDPVEAGADRAAQTFRGRSDDAAYAVKWSSGGSAAGLMLPSRLADHGARSVAAPVRTRDGHLWAIREGRRLSVTPWVGDRKGIDDGLRAGQWRALGALLAQTHALPLTDDLAAVLPVADHTWHLAKARTVDALLGATAAPDATAAAVQRLWLEHADQIQAVAALIEQLAPKVTPTTVCHTDPHLGNVLAAPGHVWLIDWDDAALSTPEHDLMFVLGGAYGDEHIGDQQRTWFFQGYGTASPDPSRLAYWRGARGLDDIASLAEEAFTPGTLDDAGRSAALRMMADQLTPTSLIALALG